MFEIEGVLAEKFFQGHVLRLKRAFKITLHTERGVMNYLEEQKPFSSVTIYNVLTRKDVTSYFLGQA